MKSRWRSGVLLAGIVVAIAGTGCGGAPDALDAVYRIEVEQCRTADLQIATAAAVGTDLVATVAHSLVEVERLSLLDPSGAEVGAEIVYLDPLKDVAVLRIDRAALTVLTLGDPVEGGEVSVVSGADEDGPQVKDAVIVRLVDATLDGEGKRAAIRLEADISPGDSGAPVVDEDGLMVGMIFAAVRGQDEVGWAVSSREISDAIEQLSAGGSRIPAPVC